MSSPPWTPCCASLALFDVRLIVTSWEKRFGPIKRLPLRDAIQLLTYEPFPPSPPDFLDGYEADLQGVFDAYLKHADLLASLKEIKASASEAQFEVYCDEKEAEGHPIREARQAGIAWWSAFRWWAEQPEFPEWKRCSDFAAEFAARPLVEHLRYTAAVEVRYENGVTEMLGSCVTYAHPRATQTVIAFRRWMPESWAAQF